jgi:hypothetical protein
MRDTKYCPSSHNCSCNRLHNDLNCFVWIGATAFGYVIDPRLAATAKARELHLF